MVDQELQQFCFEFTLYDSAVPAANMYCFNMVRWNTSGL